METLFSALVGLGLAASCGFRVFVPFLLLSLASRSGHVELAGGFAWIASDPALIAFIVATVLEIAGHYLPFVDHVLDVLSLPVAMLAGAMITAAAVGNMSPWLSWSLALIAGTAVAGVTKSLSGATRLTSTAVSGGLMNPLFTTVETFGSFALSALALLVPLLAAGVVFLIFFATWRMLFGRLWRKFRGPGAPQPGETPLP